ncbi:MAG: hypothetical protein ABR608_12730 [Pseudonocardiaceae bacterium]
MAGSVHLLGLAGRVAAVLLVLSSYVGTELAEPGTAKPGPAESGTAESGTLASAIVIAERGPASETRAPVEGPALVDTEGARLQEEHAEVVRAVHRALTVGDLTALRELYAGDDWGGQVELLAAERVRAGVLDALGANPANLGEGYVYPGFAADSTTPYPGYRTAFFLDYDPPQKAAGPLRWRGIAPPAPAALG